MTLASAEGGTSPQWLKTVCIRWHSVVQPGIMEILSVDIEDTRRRPVVGSPLGLRLRRRPNGEPTTGQLLTSAGEFPSGSCCHRSCRLFNGDLLQTKPTYFEAWRVLAISMITSKGSSADCAGHGRR